MKKSKFSKLFAYILCAVLIAAAALSMSGCSEQKSESGEQTVLYSSETLNILGEGNKRFSFVVVDTEGVETKFEIHTDAETVGEALLDLGLIGGDEEEYGLYVKTVNGLTYDYDTDGKYWALYENGEYGLNGVDRTVIDETVEYAFKAE